MRIGVAGIGIIAKTYLSLIVAGRAGKVTVGGVSSRDTEKAKRVLNECGLCDVPVFADFKELLHSNLIDMVIICTPHRLHPSMAIESVHAGIPALIEKPIGISMDEVLELLRVEQEAGDILCGVYYCRRMSPVFQDLKQRLDTGELGRIKRIHWMVTNLYRTQTYHNSSSWRGSYQGEGGGILLTQASHQLDLFLWLAGMPKTVSAFCYQGMERKIEVENDVLIQMEYEGQKTGQFIASSREFPGTNRLEITGNLGKVILEEDRFMTVHCLSMPESKFSVSSNSYFGPIPYSTTQVVHPFAENEEQQAAMIRNFVEAVEMKTQPACSISDAACSLEITNAAYLSSWTKSPVTLPLPLAEYRQALNQRMK